MTQAFFWCILAFTSLPEDPAGCLRMRFDVFGDESGLSQNGVTCMVQDARGFLWVGTMDGLNRFDGHHFKTYRQLKDHDAKRMHSIQALAVDHQNRLWAGLPKGLVIYKAKYDTFAVFEHPNFPQLSQANIKGMAVDNEGTLWVTTSNQGVYQINPEKNTYRNIQASGKGLPADAFWQILADQWGRIWMCGEQTGITRFKPATHHWTDVAVELGEPRLSGFNFCLMEDKDGAVWVGTQYHGLLRIDKKDGVTEFPLVDRDGKPIQSVVALAQDRDGRIWVASHGQGLFILDPETGGSLHLWHRAVDPKSISSNYVLALFRDRTDIMWAGTHGGGLNKHNPATEAFVHLSSRSPEPFDLPEERVHALDKVGDDLWIGTFGRGVIRLNLQKGTKKIYQWPSPVTGKASTNFVTVLHRGRSGSFWAGTWGTGLRLYDAEQDQFISAPFPELAPNASLTAIQEDSNGVLWVATEGELVHLGSEAQRSRTPLPEIRGPDSLILAMLEDSENRMWLGFEEWGLAFWDSATQQLNHTHFGEAGVGISVFDLALSPDQQLWAATSQGLFKIQSDAGGSFATWVIRQDVTYHHRLPHSVIKSLIFDQAGYLWFTTYHGMMRLDTHNEGTLLFTNDNGLPGGEFFPHARLLDAEGQLWFGTQKGVMGFHPRIFGSIPPAPPVEIYQADITAGEETFSKSIWPTITKLKLPPEQKSWTIRFTTLDFGSPQNHQFKYQLYPFNHEWQKLGGERQVTFSNLPAGHYKFRVKGSDGYGTWQKPISELAIWVIPPFYWSWWAKVFYAVAIFLLIGILALRYRNRLRRQAADLVRRKQESQQREKMEALGRMAGGVAHEFNNMLASVLGFNYLAMAEVAPGDLTHQYLKEIETAGLHAKDMVHRILTFSRKGRPQYEALEADRVIGEALKLARVGFPPDLELNVTTQAMDLWVLGNATQLSQVVLNLCANAVAAMEKAPKELRIDLSTITNSSGADTLLLTVSDTGKGMPEEVRKNIFDPFFTTKKQGEGTGLGLSLVHGIVSEMGGTIDVQSQEGKGTRFSIRLPLLSAKPDFAQVRAPIPLDGKNQSVVWIDDDTSILRFGSAMLEQLGFQAHPFASANEALAKVQLGNFPMDALICDLQMPEISGETLLQKIRLSHPKLPIIICTGQPNRIESENLLQLVKNAESLSKPFSPEELKRALVSAFAMVDPKLPDSKDAR